MSWVKRRGVLHWDGSPFPEPTDDDLAPYAPTVTSWLKPHGTPAAYRRHKRAGEDPCAKCREAGNQQKRDSRDRLRRAKEGAA